MLKGKVPQSHGRPKTILRILALGLAVLASPFAVHRACAAEGDGAAVSSSAPPASSPAKGLASASDRELIQQLMGQISALENRVADMEAREEGGEAAKPAAESAPDLSPSAPPHALPGRGDAPPNAPVPPSGPPQMDSGGGHNMDIPGGPKLNIHGFLDFNLDAGAAANPLIYPLTQPPSTVHNGFQFGEFDLFVSSKLSNTINFVSELVFGSDASNFWGIDIERAQLTYKPNDFFQISAGRMHTAIGYYNTAYHHGTWFQTATGRPFMFFYEDSGGILPVHIVGVSATGLVPRTGKLNLHWTAEVGNGESSSFIGQPIVAQPVQNFLTDTNHKAFNLAAYVRPDWLSGLQIGGNYYNSERVPAGIPHVANTITGLYVIYITPVWEFLNEFQVQRDRSLGSSVTFNAPLGYTQVSRKFGLYRPYFRWQEVNVPAADPLYGFVGRYEGPSVGLRMDFSAYVAFKMQYNRLYTRAALPENGLDSQVSFTF
jgi:hypothetical protein